VRGMRLAPYNRATGLRAKGLWASNAAFRCPLFTTRTPSVAPRRSFEATAPGTGIIVSVYS
jgi:hypothetical protein